ncbi:MAG: hypothetical protein LC122_12975 [Chitinophagales bacterium]|nr:hypothetical protein [Chitinophagales bacterium]
MNFKNIKFEESEVMQSLEKIAKDKGWVKEEIKKKASVKLAATNDFDLNIVNLISVLNDSGKVSLAKELSKNYLLYKQASNEKIYDVNLESLEKLLNAAHPKSAKIEGVEKGELALVEDLYEQNKKMLEIVNNFKLKKKANLIKEADLFDFSPGIGFLGGKERREIAGQVRDAQNSLFNGLKKIYENFSGLQNLYSKGELVAGLFNQHKKELYNILHSNITFEHIGITEFFSATASKPMVDLILNQRNKIAGLVDNFKNILSRAPGLEKQVESLKQVYLSKMALILKSISTEVEKTPKKEEDAKVEPSIAKTEWISIHNQLVNLYKRYKDGVYSYYVPKDVNDPEAIKNKLTKEQIDQANVWLNNLKSVLQKVATDINTISDMIKSSPEKFDDLSFSGQILKFNTFEGFKNAINKLHNYFQTKLT